MNIFELPDGENFSDKINLDELYDKKREYDESKLVTYNKILNRVHTKIKNTSRQSIHERCCWYIIPEIMIGITRYNVQECTSFLLSKLSDNGFTVKYTHPNLLFICWNHWIPDYVRKEMKKQTGVEIDGYGNEIQKNKGGLNMGKKTAFATTPTYFNNPSNYLSTTTSPHNAGRNPSQHANSQAHVPSQPSNSLNNLVISNPTQVRDSYRNPLVNHTPFDNQTTELKYDPNNHQVSYEPYKLNYMTSTSTKGEETKNSTQQNYLDHSINNMKLPQQQDSANANANANIPSSKRDPPEYKSVRTYKPSGIYNAEMFSQLKNKLSK